MTRALCFDRCKPQLEEMATSLELDIVVSNEPPLVDGPYTMPPMTCPHGASYWLEPTGEQIAYWAEHRIP